MPHGKLDVYVEGAVQIKDTTILGKGSPYCTLTLGAQVFSSPPVPEGGAHPYFNTRFEFQVDHTTEQLLVQIFSKKTLTDDDLLGYCMILFRDAFFLSHVLPVTPYALMRPSGRPGGVIRLSLTFKAQPRPTAPPAGYMPPQPRPAAAGPYRQPRPVVGPPPGEHYRQPRPVVGPPPGGPHYRQPRPPPPPQHPRPNYYATEAVPHPPHEPRRMNEEDSDSSQSSRSDSDDEGMQAPGPYVPARGEYEYRCRGRGRAGPPPGRGGPRPRPPGPHMVHPPPPLNNNGLRNVRFPGPVAGSGVGSLSDSDGDGSDWGGGDEDVSVDGSYGHVETASYGSARDEDCHGFYDNHGAVAEVDHAEAYDDDRSYGQDAAGAPRFGPPVGYATPPAAGAGVRGRGRIAGPPGRAGRAGPPVGRAGMVAGAGRRGRGPPTARGGPPRMRGRAGPLIQQQAVPQVFSPN